MSNELPPGTRVKLTIGDRGYSEADLKYLRRPDGYDGKELTVFGVIDTELRGRLYQLTDDDDRLAYAATPSEVEPV